MTLTLTSRFLPPLFTACAMFEEMICYWGRETDNTACVRFTKVESLDRTIAAARTLFGRTAAVRGSPIAAHPPERAGMSRASGELLNWRAFSQECDKGLIKTKRGRFL